MEALFAAASFWVWALSIAAIVVLYLALLCDNGKAATASLLGYLVLLYWFAGVNTFTVVKANPYQFAIFVVVYFLAGLCWGVFKWRRVIANRIERYNESKAEFLRSRKLPENGPIPESLKAEWKRVCEGGYSETKRYQEHGTGLHLVPRIRDHKSDWLRWATWWPISAVVYIFNDFLKDLFNRIYKAIAGILQAMADRMWEKAKVSADFASNPEEE